MTGSLLITGANGYLGANCVERLIYSSEREVVATWGTRRDRLLAKPPAHLHYEQCDLTDWAQVNVLFQRWKIHEVIHTAALLPDTKPDFLRRAIQSNIVATAHLVECALNAGCTRFVYCSSISVYGMAPCPALGWDECTPVAPSSIYGWTKHAGEECVRLHSGIDKLTGVSLRLSGLHGPGRNGGAVFHMMRAALAGQPLVVNNQGSRFQLLFVDDAIESLRLALKDPMPTHYHCINLSSHIFTSLKQLAEYITVNCESKSAIQAGTEGEGGDQIMNTVRMNKLLGLNPQSVDAHLDKIRTSLEGMHGRYA